MGRPELRRHSPGKMGPGLSLAIHPRACLSLPGPRGDLHFHILPRIRGQPGSTIQGSGTIPHGTSWVASLPSLSSQAASELNSSLAQ